MKKKYLGFTLVEMLIVMGIMIILMAAGIAGGRFAIQRANRIQKEGAVRAIYQAAMGYYTDFRQFPSQADPKTLAEESSPTGMADYFDAGAFDGGVDGDFYVYINGERQLALFCAQYTSDGSLGGVCEGNGFADIDCDSDTENIDVSMEEDQFKACVVDGQAGDDDAFDSSTWDQEAQGWE